MRITGNGGQDVTAEVLRTRLNHTVEQHLEENGKNKAVISDQQNQLDQQNKN
jgi:hypothetical protein